MFVIHLILQFYSIGFKNKLNILLMKLDARKGCIRRIHEIMKVIHISRSRIKISKSHNVDIMKVIHISRSGIKISKPHNADIPNFYTFVFSYNLQNFPYSCISSLTRFLCNAQRSMIILLCSKIENYLYTFPRKYVLETFLPWLHCNNRFRH